MTTCCQLRRVVPRAILSIEAGRSPGDLPLPEEIAQAVATRYSTADAALERLRSRVLARILVDFRDSLVEPKCKFNAAALEGGWTKPETGSPRLIIGAAIVYGPEGLTRLRTDQLISANFWRIGFDLGEGAAAEFVNAVKCERALVRLNSELRSMNVLTKKWIQKTPVPRGEVTSSRTGRQFEQLVVDILNEHESHARRASVDEDHWEKTDVRVRYQDLRRKRGARLQVSLHSSLSGFESKLSRMPFTDELVLVSPVTLAATIMWSDRQLGLSSVDWVALARDLDPPSWSPGLLADRLKRVFLDSFARRTEHPLGPLASIPESVRDFVRAFIRRGAFETTARMRKRRARSADTRQTLESRVDE